MICSLQLQLCCSSSGTALNGLFFKTKYLRKGTANMKYTIGLFTPKTKPTFHFGVTVVGKTEHLCILALCQEPWFISKPWRFHYSKQILEIFFKIIIYLLFYWMMLYLLCVYVCMCVFQSYSFSSPLFIFISFICVQRDLQSKSNPFVFLRMLYFFRINVFFNEFLKHTPQIGLTFLRGE